MSTRVFRWLLVCTALLTVFVTGGDRARAASANLVISQIYGGGGNTGALYQNDYIEVFNSGNTAVSLSGLSVQYASATGSSWAVTSLGSGTLAPGQYLLVREGSGGTAGVALPTADALGSINLSATSGKVVLAATTSQLTGVCPATGVIDLVAFGTNATCAEGGANAIAGANAVAIFRKAAGCTDTDNNGLDFSSGTPAPRNSSTTLAPCGAVADAAPTLNHQSFHFFH